MPPTSTNSTTKITGKVYARLSKDKKDQTSLADQERKCRAHLHSLGVADEDITVFTEDAGTSGYKEDVELPERDRFVDHPADIAIVWMHDRLSRRGVEDSFRCKRLLEERGSRYIAMSDGIDSLLEGNDIQLAVRAIMANQYSKSISKNVKRGKETGAIAGKWNGGQRWYGYSPDPDDVWRGPTTIDEAEAKILREIRDRYVQGESFTAIARDLNRRNITTVRGAQWKPENIPHLVFNRRYVGIRVHKEGTPDEAEYPAAWPALFTTAEYAELKVVRQTAERTKKWPTKPGGARTFLLTGFLRCPCGGRQRGSLRKTRRGTKQRRYRCASCHGSLRIADPLEHFVSEAVLYRLDSPALGKMLTGPNQQGAVIESITCELEAVSSRQKELDDYYFNPQPGEPPLSRAEYARQKNGLVAAQEAAEARLRAEVQKRTGVRLEAGQKLRTAWESWDLAKRRQLIGLVISHIDVLPTVASMKRADYYQGRWPFRPSDIRIHWNDQEGEL